MSVVTKIKIALFLYFLLMIAVGLWFVWVILGMKWIILIGVSIIGSYLLLEDRINILWSS